MKNFIISIIAVIIGLAVFNAYQKPQEIVPEGYSSLEEFVVEKTNENLDLGATKPAGLFTYRLSGAGISSSATSLTLTSLTLPQNDYPIQDSDLSDTFYLTLEPGSTSRQEFVSCTTVGANSGGSVSISGCTRGLSPISPYTASSTLQFSHSGGSAVIFSDPPQLFEEFAANANTEIITGNWRFAAVPSTTDECTETAEFCSKNYIDNSVNQGAATSTESIGGIVELGTALETASSTDGGASKPLVLQTKNASSTPGSSCDSSLSSSAGALCTVVATLTGKISQLWLDLTAAFTWLGNHIFQGNVTITGDLTVNNASSTVTQLITNNATSTDSFHFNELIDSDNNSLDELTRVASSSRVSISHTGNTSQTTLRTYTLAAGEAETGDVYRLRGGFNKSNENNVAYINVIFNGVQMWPLTSGCNTGNTAGTTVRGVIDASFTFGEGNNLAIDIMCIGSQSGSLSFATSTASTTIDFTNETKTIDITGELVHGSDTVTMQGFSLIKTPSN